jgi:hypothetical protein
LGVYGGRSRRRENLIFTGYGAPWIRRAGCAARRARQRWLRPVATGWAVLGDMPVGEVPSARSLSAEARKSAADRRGDRTIATYFAFSDDRRRVQERADEPAHLLLGRLTCSASVSCEGSAVARECCRSDVSAVLSLALPDRKTRLRDELPASAGQRSDYEVWGRRG